MTSPQVPDRILHRPPQTSDEEGLAGIIPPGLAAGDQNAYVTLKSVLGQWGLGSLASTALGFIQAGYDTSTTQYLLTQTPEYGQRFSGNAQRIKDGLPPLSPADYISTESSYRQVMASAGLPSNFYDSDESLAGFIGNDMSPTELQSRVSLASTLVNQTDPGTRQALGEMYGINQGHLVAHFLDPTVAAPILQKQEQAATIGGAALAQGLGVTGTQTAEKAADLGVTQQQATSDYSKLAGLMPAEQNIGERFGDPYTQQKGESEFLLDNAGAAQDRKKLNKKEEALFQSDTGLANSTFGGGTRAGSLELQTKGSF